MFDIKDFLKITLTVLGTVIGAGFISGREIVTFFYGKDLLVSAAIFALLFFFSLCLLFYDKSYTSSGWFSFSKPFIYVGELVLASGMLSALDGFYWQIFPDLKPYPVLSIFSIVISNVIVGDGIKGLKTANLYLTPVIIFITCFSLFFTNGLGNFTEGEISVMNVCGYVGLNIFTSSVVFVKLGEKASVKTSLFAAAFSSLALSALIVVIMLALQNSDISIINADMPLLRLFENNAFIKWLFSFAVLFGVFTTLLSSHYPLYELVGTKKLNFIPQTILSALIFGISRLGFYNIVSYVYPILGGVGIIYIAVTCFLQAVFRSRRRKNTSAPQEYKV